MVWHIAIMKESRWVKWIHNVYTKGGDWRVFNPPPTASWMLRKLCKVKEQMQEWTFNNTYSIQNVYDKHMEAHNKVRWDTMVWHRYSIPRSRFIFWLAPLNKLKTRDRLLQIGVSTDPMCPICGSEPESHAHLFFMCTFSNHMASLHPRRWKLPRYRNKLLVAALAYTMYIIWCTRNTAIWCSYVKSPQQAMHRVKIEVAMRI